MVPLVSIGIPTYNGAKYLRESVESVLAQTFKEFEVAIIDDRSSDETWAIAEEYARKDARIVVRRNSKTVGLAANFNRCVESTQGRYLCVWHQDDVMLPQNIEKKVALLEANPRVGLVHSNVLMIDDQGRVLSEHWESDSTRDYVCRGFEFFLKMVEGNNHVCCPSVVARRECYEKLGNFRTELFYTCDWEMWMRMALYYDVACLGEPLVRNRFHECSESYRISGSVSEIEQEVLAKLLVLTEQRHRIPHVGALENRVRKSFSKDELLRARKAFYENNFPESWRHWWFGIKIHPASLCHPEFASLLPRLLLGPRCVGAYRRIKAVLFEHRY